MKSDNLVPVLRELLSDKRLSQRELARRCLLSLGTVNRAIQYAKGEGWLEADGTGLSVTKAGRSYLETYRVKNAIVLAAGFGSRCVPLTYETPKGLLKVKGKPMLERQIEQLLEVGIEEILVVVGYLKEAFDYLIDKYGVRLIYNPDYATANNYASLYQVADYLDNSYVLVADNWMKSNMFKLYETSSWYSCLYFEGETDEWCVETTASGLIKSIRIGGRDSLAIVGPAYFDRNFSARFRPLLEATYGKSYAADYYWENILKDHLEDLPMKANVQTGNVYEFENLEELRAFDKSYLNNTKNKIMEYIASQHQVSQGAIQKIEPMKEGLTNQSFKFSIAGEEYVFRQPGEGTDKLINRADEKATYDLLEPLIVTDEVVSFDPESGVRITRYYDGARVADPFSDQDLRVSMEMIRRVHERKLKVDFRFDIRGKIDYYEGLVQEIGAMRFRDYEQVREKALGLLDLKDRLNIEEVLCHGDYLYANVLFLKHGGVRLIDWEYSGLADPIMDVSMYAIFSEFDRGRIDLSLKYYLGREPQAEETLRLYLYVALGGFLWSMWGSFKQELGLELGEYPMKMYRYMKDFYPLIREKRPFLPA